jgi:hypothetical protein
MGQYHLSTAHLWAEQQITIAECTFFHRQCRLCGRDFVKSLDDGEWRAVHVGVLKFDFLDEETTRRWVSEECPGRRLPGKKTASAFRHREKCVHPNHAVPKLDIRALIRPISL